MTQNHWNYSDRTLFGNHSDTGRYIWIVFTSFALLSSLIGDTTILIAAVKYKAFKLHKLIVIIIQHIAVADLMVSITFLFPKLISQIAGYWVFGDLQCNISPYLTYYTAGLGIQLIGAMTTSKVFILKFPFRSVTFSRRRAHFVCAMLWFWASTVPFSFLVVQKEDVFFDYRIYTCDYGYSADSWKWLKPLTFILFVVIPNILVVSTTIYLLIMAKRSVTRRGRDNLKWQGIMTTALTGTVYCVSTLPYAVFRIGETIVSSENKAQSFFHTGFLSLANDFLFLNTISNIYIYSLTVSSFRRFLLAWIRPSTHGSSVRQRFQRSSARSTILYAGIQRDETRMNMINNNGNSPRMNMIHKNCPRIAEHV